MHVNVKSNNLATSWRAITCREEASRRFRKGSKYDPIIDAFLSSNNDIVIMDVEGNGANYLRMQLKKRIDVIALDKNIDVSVINNDVYIEKT